MMAHEAKHKADDNLDCPSCEPRYANPVNGQQYQKDHCALYNETLACLNMEPKDAEGRQKLIDLVTEAYNLSCRNIIW